MNNSVSVDETLCPLCQQKNNCQVDSASSCWCMQADIPEQLKDKVPESLKGKACICQKCQRAFVVTKQQ